ncbi:hypothetical protein N9K45_00240 [bacterium]|nr:hypothetical protein [bacterium]
MSALAASPVMAMPTKAEADEPWKLQAAKTAVKLSKFTFDTSFASGESYHRFMDHADGSNLVVPVRDDFSDQQLLNVFANYAIATGCTVVAWDSKTKRFADLSKGGMRERRRTHAGMVITATRAGAGGKLRALFSIKHQGATDSAFSRKFMHVVADGRGGALACCAGRAGGSASAFFAGLSATLHSAGATEFAEVPPLPKDQPANLSQSKSAVPNQVIGDGPAHAENNEAP